MEEAVKEKLMTAKGVAEQLKCSERTIRDYASKLGFTKNGVKTLLNNFQVTSILEEMKKANNNQNNLTVELRKVSTVLTPALRIKNAMLEMQSAYEEELANLKAQNIEVIEENGQLKLQVNQLEHALEYDKIAGWKPWSHLKKEIQYKGNFQKLVDSIPLIKDEDFAKKVMADDCYPTTLISLTGEEKIIDYKENVLDEAV